MWTQQVLKYDAPRNNYMGINILLFYQVIEKNRINTNLPLMIKIDIELMYKFE